MQAVGSRQNRPRAIGLSLAIPAGLSGHTFQTQKGSDDMATGLEEIEAHLADPISLDECGGNPERYAANVLRWALSLAMIAERAPGFIRNAEDPRTGQG